MALPDGLDLGLLRTFVAIAEELSFTRAAERVGRTQSAVSLQVQKLEAAVGQELLTRGRGGSVGLTPQGSRLLVRAREILALNDDILASLRNAPVKGTLRFGVPDEFSSGQLSAILSGFVEEMPGVEVEVVNDLSCKLAHHLKLGELDLAIMQRGLEPRQWPAEELFHEPLRWITSDQHRQHVLDTLPVTISPLPCEWRPPWLTECLWNGMALRALENCGRAYHVASRSLTTAGQLAMVMAGKAVMVSLETLELPQGLRLVAPDEGLPELPEVAFLLLRGKSAADPAIDALAAHVRRVVAAQRETKARPSPPPSRSDPPSASHARD